MSSGAREEELGAAGEDKSEAKVLEIVKAFSDFCSIEDNQLTFRSGAEISVLQKTNNEWWWAELDGRHGYIPVNHVMNQSELKYRESWQDEEYFDNYGGLKLQQEMLADQPRTLAYKNAIEKNVEFLKGKTVLDVGCGTGILSLFCATYGKVKKVYAVERSFTARYAKELVLHNGLTDVIQVIEDFVEDVTLPEKVDLIISEWMGTALLFEMMLESVVIARNKFLKEGGVLWPSVARLHLTPCSAQKIYDERINFWDVRYGIDLSPLRDRAMKEYFSRPIHNHHMSPEDSLADDETVFDLDLVSVNVDDLEVIEREFDFLITKTSPMHGFCCWFGIDFGGSPQIENIVTLNTGPENELTHWKQNLFMMDQPISVSAGDHVRGTFRMMRNPEWRRHLRINYNYTIQYQDGETKNFQKEFKLWR